MMDNVNNSGSQTVSLNEQQTIFIHVFIYADICTNTFLSKRNFPNVGESGTA